MSRPVSVVLACMDDTALLQKHLPPLLEECARRGVDDEIIVVDDTGSDVLAPWLRQRFPGVRCLAHTKNTGFANAMFDGFAQARHALVFAMNPDVLVRAGLPRSAGGLLRRRRRRGRRPARLAGGRERRDRIPGRARAPRRRAAPRPARLGRAAQGRRAVAHRADPGGLRDRWRGSVPARGLLAARAASTSCSILSIGRTSTTAGRAGGAADGCSTNRPRSSSTTTAGPSGGWCRASSCGLRSRRTASSSTGSTSMVKPWRASTWPGSTASRSTPSWAIAATSSRGWPWRWKRPSERSRGRTAIEGGPSFDEIQRFLQSKPRLPRPR